MLLDLRGIMDNPGSEITFEYEPDMTNVQAGSILQIKENPKIKGKVTNRAGVPVLNVPLDVICLCSCARCLKEFELPVSLQITAYLTEESETGLDTEYYFIIDNKIDLDEIIISEFLLNIDERILCFDNCPGLCAKCGFDLNNGSCDCKDDIDPRLAKLAELLED